jgi:hypothetical protein
LKTQPEYLRYFSLRLKNFAPLRALRLCGKLFLPQPPRMSTPLNRKNLPENPTPDDILNAFLDYLTTTDTKPYDHQ